MCSTGWLSPGGVLVIDRAAVVSGGRLLAVIRPAPPPQPAGADEFPTRSSPPSRRRGGRRRLSGGPGDLAAPAAEGAVARRSRDAPRPRPPRQHHPAQRHQHLTTPRHDQRAWPDFYIRDEGSRGGTFVNRRRLHKDQKVLLHHDDIVQFYTFTYQFVLSEAPTQVNDSEPTLSTRLDLDSDQHL